MTSARASIAENFSPQFRIAIDFGGGSFILDRPHVCAFHSCLIVMSLNIIIAGRKSNVLAQVRI